MCCIEPVFYDIQLFSSPCLLVFQLLQVPQLDQEHLVFLACQALQQAPGIPLVLVLQWLFQEAQLIPWVLAPLVPPLLPSPLEHHEHPSIQQETRWMDDYLQF